MTKEKVNKNPNILDDLMKQKGYRYDQIAVSLGFSTSYLYNLAAGKYRTIGDPTRRKLSKLFEMPIEKIFPLLDPKLED